MCDVPLPGPPPGYSPDVEYEPDPPRKTTQVPALKKVGVDDAYCTRNIYYTI